MVKGKMSGSDGEWPEAGKPIDLLNDENPGTAEFVEASKGYLPVLTASVARQREQKSWRNGDVPAMRNIVALVRCNFSPIKQTMPEIPT